MLPLLSPLRAALATDWTDATPSALAGTASGRAGTQAVIAALEPAPEVASDLDPYTPPAINNDDGGKGRLNAGLLDSLPRSEFDALLRGEMGFRVRELTSPYEALASAVPKAPGEKQVGLGEALKLLPDSREFGGGRDYGIGNGRDFSDMGARPGLNRPGGGTPKGPDINPRADLGDGDGLGNDPSGKEIKLPGRVVPGGDPDFTSRAAFNYGDGGGDGEGDGDGSGKQPAKVVPMGTDGGGSNDGERGFGVDRFRAYDIDVMSQYRDPDMNPRAECGSSDGCGTTAGGCGSTGGCGTTAGGCGSTGGCGTTAGGCGSTGGCGSSAVGCGSTGDGCGTSSGVSDHLSAMSRTELLRQQLATQLLVDNAKLAI